MLSFDQPDVIELMLDDVDELFEARRADARAGRGGAPAGMVQLERRLAVKHPAADWPQRLRLRLPAGSPGADATLVTQAVRRWCETELEGIDLHRQMMSRERRTAWIVGILFLITCVLAAGLLEAMRPFSDFWTGLLSESFIIAGWVGLWRPLELTLYDWWPDARRRKLLERMRELEVELAAAG
jgi:hypothetical protein